MDSNIFAKQASNRAGKRSGEVTIGCGIPQGPLLGPIMFIFYINSMTTSNSNLKVTMYAGYVLIVFKNKLLLHLEIDSYFKLVELRQYLNNKLITRKS